MAREQVFFHDGQVITVDDRFSVHDAVLVEDGRITAVGQKAALADAVSTNACQIDLAGRTLMPGFIDTHGHIALFGLDELKVRLQGATTKREILERLKAAVDSASPGEWIVSMPIGDPPYFLNAERLRAAGEVPTLAELDQLAPDNPVYIQAPTNRVPNFAILNSRALAAAGIDAGTRVSDNTRILTDDKGEPNGLEIGRAHV